jgi:ribosome biogenesis GTPase
MSEIRQEYPEEIKDFSGSYNIALERLGFDQWFQDKSELHAKDDFSMARVTEVNRSRYKVCGDRHNETAKLSGRFVYKVENSIDYPTVGDWVVTQFFDDNSIAVIHGVLPRKSLLKRKDPGRDVAFQLIAANIDYALVIQSVDSNFDLNRLERYLVMVNESEIQPIVVLSKTDLISDAELCEITDKLKRFDGKYLFLPLSNVTNDGIEALQAELKLNHTYCLLGSSGVGKTTLLNTLIGEELLEVNEVREKDSKGMHTTTKRQLVRLESGSIFIDTPGMRELGNFAVDSGLEETFDEIISHSGNCHFNDCTHTHEKKCAVIAAVEQGVIDQGSYENYLKIQRESTFYETSYQDKRKKSKASTKTHKKFMKASKKK